jgi:RNA polymerase sigma-32 factor
MAKVKKERATGRDDANRRSTEDPGKKTNAGDVSHEPSDEEPDDELDDQSLVSAGVDEANLAFDGEDTDALLELGTEPEGGEDGDKSLARYDALQAYMLEIRKHPLLSSEEEHRLAVDYKDTGDVDVAARLVTANLRLVVKLAYEYRRAYKNMMDLIQEGNIGLMQAVKRYDPYRGVKLSSYAAWWIRAYMLRFILNNWRLVKLGTTQAQRKLFFNLNKEKQRLAALGIEPTSAEIAKRLDVAEAEVIEMDRRLARSDASLDSPITEGDGRTASRLELLPGSGDTPESAAEGAEIEALLHEQLDAFRKTLSGKDVLIFEKRLVADEPLTLQELGDQFGVSRERVRQLEARLTGRLREHLKKTLGDAVGVG